MNKITINEISTYERVAEHDKFTVKLWRSFMQRFLAITVVIMVLCSFTACSSINTIPTTSSSAVPSTTPVVETSTQTQIQNSIFPTIADANEMHTFFVGYSDSIENPSPAKKAFWNAVEYRITETTIDNDNTGTAKVTIITPDMAVIMEKAFKQCLSTKNTGITQSELNNQLKTEIVEALADTSKVITTNITMEMVRDNNEWKLMPNEEWQKAVFGGAEEVFNKYMQQYLDNVIMQEDDEVAKP